jgi:hypothetical protein
MAESVRRAGLLMSSSLLIGPSFAGLLLHAYNTALSPGRSLIRHKYPSSCRVVIFGHTFVFSLDFICFLFCVCLKKKIVNNTISDEKMKRMILNENVLLYRPLKKREYISRTTFRL